jgi:hypothetical protein
LIFEDQLKGKNVTHFLNADRRSYLGKGAYKRLGITDGIIGWTRLHELPGKGKVSRGKNTVAAAVNKYSKALRMRHLPDFYYDFCWSMKSAGLLCLFYVSRELMPKDIWVLGMDFYVVDYLVQRAGKCRPVNTLDMARDFATIVNSYPDVTYNVKTYYKELPEFPNVRYL